MKHYVLILIITLFSISCKDAKQNKTDEKDNTSIKTTSTPEPIEIGCYEYLANGSSIKLMITKTEPIIAGDLNYRLKEKDANTGSFSGKVEGDKLFGTYTFISEGIESTREIAFKISDGKLIEGFGELNSDGTTFKNRKNLEYNDSMPLTKTECQ